MKAMMKKSIKASMVAFAIFLCACQGKKNDQNFNGDPKLPVIKVTKSKLNSFTTYPTTIEGIQSIDIRAKVDGYINKVYVDEGEIVKAGTTLFKLETRSLTQDAQAAKSALELAQLEVEKLTPLVEQQIVSSLQLQTAEKQLQQAKASYQSILANIEYTNIKSPVNGTVSIINFREGTLVSPGMPEALTQVSNTNDVYAFFTINEKSLINLLEKTPGTNINEKITNMPKVDLVLANGSVYPYQGTIETIAGHVDKTTGGVQVRATFPNPNYLLRNGNSGKIRFPVSYNDYLVIPHQCSFEIQGMTHVYLISKDNTLESKVIEVEAKVGRYLVVKNGLKEGQVILAKEMNKIYPGSKIIPEKITEKELIESFQTTFK